MQQAVINKSIIRDFYRRAIGQGDIAFAEQIIDDAYIQHSQQAGLKPGKAGVLDALSFMKQQPKPASTTAPFMRLIADGEFVVTNLRFDWGGHIKVVVDLFRFQNGKLMEHWDIVEDQPATALNENAMMDGPQPSDDHTLTDENKKRVADFYRLVFIEHQLDRLPDFVDQDLTQHAPDIANGLSGLADFLTRQNPIQTMHRIIGEGDFVVVQAEGLFSCFDIFRLHQGIIVEQWRVKQG